MNSNSFIIRYWIFEKIKFNSIGLKIFIIEWGIFSHSINLQHIHSCGKVYRSRIKYEAVRSYWNHICSTGKLRLLLFLNHRLSSRTIQPCNNNIYNTYIYINILPWYPVFDLLKEELFILEKWTIERRYEFWNSLRPSSQFSVLLFLGLNCSYNWF